MELPFSQTGITFKTYFIRQMAGKLTAQAKDGSMPAGHNGPYHDPETPVRNTSHYLIAWLKAYELSDDQRFVAAAERCLEYLVNCPHRGDYTYHHRTKPGKDKCNGLIGPAWNIEALLYAAHKLNRTDAFELARQLFILHPFDENRSVWHRVEPDGETLPIDHTFNHQLWFAAAAYPMADDCPVAASRLEAFLNSLHNKMAITRKGRIIHNLWLRENRLRNRAKRILKPAFRQAMQLKEIGYQSFNLYALAMLKQAGASLPSRVDKRIPKLIAYLGSSEFQQGILQSAAGFPYNCPGWEIPVALRTLQDHNTHNPQRATQDPQNLPICRNWIEQQINYSVTKQHPSHKQLIEDPATYAARIYETARFDKELFGLAVNRQP